MLLTLIINRPGITCAELDRLTNAGRAVHAHRVTYDAIQRLMRRRIVVRTEPTCGKGVGLKIA